MPRLPPYSQDANKPKLQHSRTKDIKEDSDDDDDSDCMILEAFPAKAKSRPTLDAPMISDDSDYKHKQNLISGIYGAKLIEK